MQLSDYAKDLEEQLRVERAYSRSLGEDLAQAREVVRVQGEFIQSLKKSISGFLNGYPGAR